MTTIQNKPQHTTIYKTYITQIVDSIHILYNFYKDIIISSKSSPICARETNQMSNNEQPYTMYYIPHNSRVTKFMIIKDSD